MSIRRTWACRQERSQVSVARCGHSEHCGDRDTARRVIAPGHDVLHEFCPVSEMDIFKQESDAEG